MNDKSTSPPVIPAEVLADAARQFNAHQFWECHETLEPVWLKAEEPAKTFIQGIIQVAAGFHHVQNGNLKGARNLLTYALEKLERTYQNESLGRLFNVADFVRQVKAIHQRLMQLEPAETVDASLQQFPQIRPKI